MTMPMQHSSLQLQMLRRRRLLLKTRVSISPYTRVTSPITGRIGKSSVTPGALVTAHQPTPLATVQQLDPTYVDVTQSTTDLLRLKQRLEEGRLNQKAKDQNKVRLILENGTTYPLEGTLQFRDVSVDPTTASVTLRLTFPNPKAYFCPHVCPHPRERGCQ